MTVKEFLAFTENKVTLMLVDTNGIILGMNFCGGRPIDEVYLSRDIDKAEILWDKQMIKLITKAELEYREAHKYTGAISDGEGDMTALISVDGKLTEVPYTMSLDVNIPDGLCKHFVLDGKDYYFG